MIKIKFIIFFLLIIFHQKSFAVENKIILKIDNEIITTIDIKNEYRYLTTLNKNFKEIEKNKALKIAKNSIIKEKIKKIELEKNINLDDINNDVLDQILKNIYFNMQAPENPTVLTKLQSYEHDANRAYLDPLFKDCKNGDFRLKPNSPALKMGIKSIDVREAGLTDDFPKTVFRK